MLSAFLTWHADRLTRIQNKLNLSSYQIAWVAFVKGLFLGVALGIGISWFFMS